MSTQTLHSISNLRKGRFTWTIKVRLIRMWRNTTTGGEFVKGLNILVLDDQHVRLHCYLPDDIEKKLIHLLTVGEIYIISNFMVKDYRDVDRFLPIRSEKQVKFTDYTKVRQLDETDSLIEPNAFDFFDIGDIEQMKQVERYLIDVVGVIEDYQPVREYISKAGKQTRDTRFLLSDGHSCVKVTFWGDFAKDFSEGMEQIREQPVILIIASAKVVQFQGTQQLKDHPATRYFFNAEHYSVRQMRKLLSEPSLTQRDVTRQNIVLEKIFTVADLKHLAKEYIGKQIVAMLTIRKIDFSNKWFYYECTSCQTEISFVEGHLLCNTCIRKVRHPNTKFQVFTICADETGGVGIVLCDREIRRLTGKTAEDYVEFPPRPDQDITFPDELKDLLYKKVTLLIEVTESNVKQQYDVFTAKDTMEGHDFSFNTFISNTYSQTPSNSGYNLTQEGTSTSEYHLDTLSGLQILSPHTQDLQSTRKNKQAMDVVDV